MQITCAGSTGLGDTQFFDQVQLKFGTIISSQSAKHVAAGTATA